MGRIGPFNDLSSIRHFEGLRIKWERSGNHAGWQRSSRGKFMMHSSAKQLPVQHLSVRLPWHDTGWSGSVCNAPSKNSWCMVLKRIREERNAAAEEDVAGSAWSDLSEAELPACLAERGAALNTKPYSLRSRHPFADSSAETHGHFAENEFRLPPYSVQTIPFRWTRKEDAQAIAEELALPFDISREPQLSFGTVWVASASERT